MDLKLPLRNGEAMTENGGSDAYGGRREVSSSASNHSSMSSLSPDGLGSPEDYCKQVQHSYVRSVRGRLSTLCA